ncbi:MAG: hypothetical protein ACTS4T_00695 [Candidatus Hodgkinia cicadicola]
MTERSTSSAASLKAEQPLRPIISTYSRPQTRPSSKQFASSVWKLLRPTCGRPDPSSRPSKELGNFRLH